MWLWRYSLGSPQMVSIAEAERIRHKSISKSRTRAAETRKLHSEAAAVIIMMLQQELPRVAGELSEVLIMISYLIL